MSERIIISKYGYGKTAKLYEDLIKETIEEKDKEIERLKNIIKEVREWSKKLKYETLWQTTIEELLEILNKVGEE